MIPLLLALLATSTRTDVVPLTSESQLRELCAALGGPTRSPDIDPVETAVERQLAERIRGEVVSRTYRVSVPAKGFVFGRYRPEQQEIELDGRRPLRTVDGALSLDLAGIDEVAFQASPKQVRDWVARKAAGDLSLVIQFHPSGEPCAGKPIAGIFRLSGEPLQWQIVSEEGPLAAADEDGAPLELGPPRVHTMRIERVALDLEHSGFEPAAGVVNVRPSEQLDDARERLMGSLPALDRCARGVRRTGAMVVAFSVLGGRLQDVQVVMDALRDESVASCVAHALSGAQLRGVDAASGRGTASIALR
ncbi:MAG: hypothetical protein ACJ78X_15100 [Myxococcales bacterium]